LAREGVPLHRDPAFLAMYRKAVGYMLWCYDRYLQFRAENGLEGPSEAVAADVATMEKFREQSIYELAEHEERGMEILAGGPGATAEEVQAERIKYMECVTAKAIKARSLKMFCLAADDEPEVPSTPVGQLLRNAFAADT
jgi:hypothetical protein